MKVAIDPELCQGHARCWDLAPDVFSLDDEGNGLVPEPDVPPAYEAKARDAVRNCPERAISLS